MATTNNNAIITIGDINNILGVGSTGYTGTAVTYSATTSLTASVYTKNFNSGNLRIIKNIPLSTGKQIAVNWTLNLSLWVKSYSNQNVTTTLSLDSNSFKFYLYYDSTLHEIDKPYYGSLDISMTLIPNQEKTTTATFTGSFIDDSITSSTNINCHLYTRYYPITFYRDNPGSLDVQFTATTNASATVTLSSLSGNSKQCSTYERVNNSSIPTNSYILWNSGNTAYNKRLIKYYDFYKPTNMAFEGGNIYFGALSGSTNYEPIEVVYSGTSRYLNVLQNGCQHNLPSWLNFHSSSRTDYTNYLTYVTNSPNGGTTNRTGNIFIKPRDCKEGISIPVIQYWASDIVWVETIGSWNTDWVQVYDKIIYVNPDPETMYVSITVVIEGSVAHNWPDNLNVYVCTTDYEPGISGSVYNPYSGHPAIKTGVWDENKQATYRFDGRVDFLSVCPQWTQEGTCALYLSFGGVVEDTPYITPQTKKIEMHHWIYPYY